MRQLYHADLFDPLLIRTLKLIPSEYFFFYYSQRKAYRNQVSAGASRGEELMRLNATSFRSSNRNRHATHWSPIAITSCNGMLRICDWRRRLGLAFQTPANEPDPFDAPTGYHKIAVEVMMGLVSDTTSNSDRERS